MVPWEAALATALATVLLFGEQAAQGQGRTVQGDAFRGQGRFLRGMAWYELGEAQANALEAEAVFAWNRAVQTDYQQYLLEKAGRTAAKKALRNEREAEANKRLEEMRRRWREKPTVDDLRSGLALNALASDLADPKISPASWRDAPVNLPPDVTIRTLAFRFADAPQFKEAPGRATGVVAVSRMKGESWPMSLRRVELNTEREAYRRAVAAAVRTCAAGKTLGAREVDAIRETLSALKEKAVDAVPTDGGVRRQAVAYLNQLDEATRLFRDRDIAEELIRDVEHHEAKTVAE